MNDDQRGLMKQNLAPIVSFRPADCPEYSYRGEILKEHTDLPIWRQKPAVTAVVVFLALLGIILRAHTLAGYTHESLNGSDFPIFYAGGRLVGTPELYSAAALRAIELREAGWTQPAGFAW